MEHPNEWKLWCRFWKATVSCGPKVREYKCRFWQEERVGLCSMFVRPSHWPLTTRFFARSWLYGVPTDYSVHIRCTLRESKWGGMTPKSGGVTCTCSLYVNAHKKQLRGSLAFFPTLFNLHSCVYVITNFQAPKHLQFCRRCSKKKKNQPNQYQFALAKPMLCLFG